MFYAVFTSYQHHGQMAQLLGLYTEAAVGIVSFPDPAFTLDKGLVHFARNLGLPDLAGKE